MPTPWNDSIPPVRPDLSATSPEIREWIERLESVAIRLHRAVEDEARRLSPLQAKDLLALRQEAERTLQPIRAAWRAELGHPRAEGNRVGPRRSEDSPLWREEENEQPPSEESVSLCLPTRMAEEVES